MNEMERTPRDSGDMGRRRFMKLGVAAPVALTLGCSGSPQSRETKPMTAPLMVTFIGGHQGQWRVLQINPVTGASLPSAERVRVDEGEVSGTPSGSAWTLRGVVGHVRYVERREKDALVAVQAGLGRPEATRAALIPIKKSPAWWALAQDERRAIFEERSHHIEASMKYLPAIARRLHQSRELNEPFDFLTWFEYAPKDAALFEELVKMLRSTEEWKYVEREVDVRLSRE